MRRILIAAMLALVTSPALAALEYYRFTGTVSSHYDASPYFDPTLGLASNQFVYFDFAVDTSLPEAGYTDQPGFDFFYSDYLGGTVASAYDSYGVSTSFPEGLTSSVYLTSALAVESHFYPSYFGDRTIGTWGIGQPLDLAFTRSHSIVGSMTLSYRGGTAPSPIPLPAPIGPLASGLVVLIGLRRKRREQ